MITVRDQYAQKAAYCQKNCRPIKKRVGWEFSCPSCSWKTSKERNARKRCAYLIFSDYQKQWFAGCKRCNDLEMKLTEFIQTYTPLFKQYQNDRFEKGTTGKGFDVPHPAWVIKLQKDTERLKTLIDKKPNTISKWTL